MYQTNAALTVPFFSKKVFNSLLKNNNKTGSNAEQSIFSRSLLLRTFLSCFLMTLSNKKNNNAWAF